MIITARIVVWLVSGISLDTVLFLKNLTLVGRWAGFEDTHYLDGLGYDSQSYDCGMVGHWDKPGCCVIFF